MQELRQKFQDVIVLCKVVEVVDANLPKDVKHLITLTNITLREVLEHQAKCKVVQTTLEIWLIRNPSRLVMSLMICAKMRFGTVAVDTHTV